MGNTVEPITPNADPAIAALIAAEQPMAADLIGILDRSYPHAVRTEVIVRMLGLHMTYSGGAFRPHTAFVSFVCACTLADQALRRYSRMLRNDGDELWISEQDRDPRLN
jgi:hypothetical protein